MRGLTNKFSGIDIFKEISIWKGWWNIRIYLKKKNSERKDKFYPNDKHVCSRGQRPKYLNIHISARSSKIFLNFQRLSAMPSYFSWLATKNCLRIPTLSASKHYWPKSQAIHHLFIIKGASEKKWWQSWINKKLALLTGGKILIVRAESVTIVRERRRSEEQCRTKLDAFFPSRASRNYSLRCIRILALLLSSRTSSRRTHTNNEKKNESDQVGRKRKKESLLVLLTKHWGPTLLG